MFPLLVWTNLAGLRPHEWDDIGIPEMYDNREINKAIKSIDNLSNSPIYITDACDQLRKLSLHAPRRKDLLEYYVKISKKCNQIVVMEGYLRCLLELDPLNESAKRSSINMININYQTF